MEGLATKQLFIFLISTALSFISAQENFGWRNKMADIYFVVDSSYSVWIGDFHKQLNFVSDMVSELDIGADKTRVGMATFSWHHNLIVSIDNTLSKEDLKQEIKDAPYTQGNNFFSRAIQGVREEGLPAHLTRPGVPKILVFMTEGEAEYSQRTRDEVTAAKREGIFIFTVGIGSGVDVRELTEMSSDPKRDFRFLVPGFDSLKTIKYQLLKNIGKVDLYQGDEATCGKNTRVDTVFVYDEASMGRYNTEKVKEFLRNMAQNFSMNPGNMRMGVYSKTCHEQKDIKLGDYVTRETFSEGLDSNPGPDISTLVSRAWSFAFLDEHGSRPDAVKRMVLIMDYRLRTRASMQDVFRETYRAKFASTEIYIIRIGSDYDKRFLDAIASSSEHLLFLDSIEQLPDKGAKKFLRSFCKDL